MKRASRRIVGVCVVIFIGAAAYVLGYVPLMWPIRAEHRSIQVLRAANSTAELREAVTPLGIFLQFPDGSWVAIRYRDSHAGLLWNGNSSAVALFSDGSWYRSHHHFCGHFLVYGWRRTSPEYAEMRAILDWHQGLEDIHRVAESRNLPDAKLALGAMQFQRFEP